MLLLAPLALVAAVVFAAPVPALALFFLLALAGAE